MNCPARPIHPLKIGNLLFSLLLLIMAAACESGSNSADSNHGEEPPLIAKNPRLKLLAASESGLHFMNYIEESHENNPTNNINIYNGGSVSVADFNRDSLPDLYFVSCSGANKLFFNEGRLKFRDATAGSGLESSAFGGFETASTVVDINNDGWPDIYVCLAGPYSPDKCRNRLFINNGLSSPPSGGPGGAGAVTFTERAKEFGLDVETKSSGANFFDYDLDGDLDVYILCYPQSFEFTSRLEAEIDPKTNKYKPNLKPKTPLDSHRLYENDSDNGRNHFKNVSDKAGIANFGYGLSVSVSDFNGDHWPDIYVGNDFIQPDLLYINQKNGTFKDELASYLKHSTRHTMGVDIADFDNDGLVDFTALDMFPHNRERQKSTMNTTSQTGFLNEITHGYFPAIVRNGLQRNNGDGTFSDIGCMANIFDTDWSWSPLFMDIDNDGLKDLGITNGYRRESNDTDFINFTFAELKKQKIKDQFPDIQQFLKLIPTFKIRNFIFKNNGDWTFSNKSGDWATMLPSWSNGAAWADFDLDGDLDWVISNLEDDPFLYENLSRSMPASNFLQLKLVGPGQNILAVGASATIETGGQLQFLELNPTRGIFSSVEHLLHFGLGEKSTVEKLVVRWPDGKTTTLQNVAANQRLTLKYAESNGKDSPIAQIQPLFKNTTAASGVNFRHQENEFNDFDQTFLMPWKYSECGPGLVSGDANGDGLDDFYVGSGFDFAGALFLQNANGTFRRSSQPTWEADKIYEDTGGLFFDADGDHDNDLFLNSGGYEATSPLAWQPRLYLNDGKGNFTKKADALPALGEVFQKATALDFDNDGDLDLFLGGRVKSRFPETPRSVILRNDLPQAKGSENGGRVSPPPGGPGGAGGFVDVTKTVGPDFEKIGMVTGLASANIDGDAAPELIVCGEWMPVSIFKMDGGRLKNVTQNFGLEKSLGLWQSLAVADLNGDGDLDLATGNFGKNTRLQASEAEPLKLFAKDFDGNGSLDPILCNFEEGKLYPSTRQDALIKQLPMLKKKFLRASDYGAATFEQVFTPEQRKGMLELTANSVASTWWENRGGKFIAHEMPLPAQVSPGLGIALADLTGDGLPDIFICGNKYGVEVETGRCDAGTGCLLAGDGKGNFTWMPNPKHGLRADREARDVAILRGPGGRKTVVVANNSDAVQVFSKL